MKFGIALLASALMGSGSADAFTAGVSRSSRVSPLREKMAEELDIPCEEECALESFPNMPASVHPGVVTGQAMVDLLDHAKENGKLPLIRGTRKSCVNESASLISLCKLKHVVVFTLSNIISFIILIHSPYTFHHILCPLGYAIPAVNCVSSSGINACLEAARKNDAPIIIQFSSGGSQVSSFRLIICGDSRSFIA